MSTCVIVKKNSLNTSTKIPGKLFSFAPHKSLECAWQSIWKKIKAKLIWWNVVPESMVHIFEDYIKGIFFENGISIPKRDCFDSNFDSHKHYRLILIEKGESVNLDGFTGVRLCDLMDPNSTFSHTRTTDNPCSAMNKIHLVVLQCAKAAKASIETMDQLFRVLDNARKKVLSIDRNSLMVPSIEISGNVIAATREDQEREKIRLLGEINVLEKQFREYFNEEVLIRQEMESIPSDIRCMFETSVGFNHCDSSEHDSLLFNAFAVKHLIEISSVNTEIRNLVPTVAVRDLQNRRERFIALMGLERNNGEHYCENRLNNVSKTYQSELSNYC